MTKKNYAIRVGSSDPNWKKDITSNHESEELKSLIERGFTVTNTKKRPRIKKKDVRIPKQVIVSLGEVMAATVTISWKSYQKHAQGMKIVMKIY